MAEAGRFNASLPVQTYLKREGPCMLQRKSCWHTSCSNSVIGNMQCHICIDIGNSQNDDTAVRKGCIISATFQDALSQTMILSKIVLLC